MVVLESLLEFSPSDFMFSRLHRLEMIPPHQFFTPKLQGHKVRLALLRKFGLYGPDPCISFMWFFCLSERWGLHSNKLGVGGDHMWSLMIGSCEVSVLVVVSVGPSAAASAGASAIRRFVL
jgi:hypothetical protein